MNHAFRNRQHSIAAGETTATGDYHGSLVSFEGPSDVISTQLRLLPASPQILILPGVQQYCANDALEFPDDAFEPISFIRAVYDAVLARNETATSFLREGSTDSKRLVFLNGGTPSAQTLCVKAIAQHETDGDIEAAESLFHDIIKNGFGGLANYRKEAETPAYGDKEEDYETDPITKAMRAADMLDRQTAGLQPCTDVDLTMRRRPRSMSLPIYGYDDMSAPFYVFGAKHQDEEGEDVEYGSSFLMDPKTPTLEVSHFREVNYEPPSPTSHVDDGPPIHSPTPTMPMTPSCIGESYRPPSIYSNLAPEEPQTPGLPSPGLDKVVYGEASVVRMGRQMSMSMSMKKPRPKRARSLDRTFPVGSRYRDIPLRTGSSQNGNKFGVGELVIRRFSCLDVAHEQPTSPATPRFHPLVGPRTIFVKPRRLGSSLKLDKIRPASYVDRGTDAEEVTTKAKPFQAVLPFAEDLVIFFKDGARADSLLDRIIKSYKDGTYPVVPQQPPLNTEGIHTPQTPTSRRSSASLGEEVEIVLDETCPVPARLEPVDEYDPFAHRQPKWDPPKPMQEVPNVRPLVPPTPAQTPPPPMNDAEEKFHDFDMASCHTAVAVQNSLRSILNIYFPPEANGFHQFNFPHLPELDGLWKPIFRDSEPDSKTNGGRRVDQILCIGAQAGVKKEYLSAISGQLEKLGTKSSGISRSGRLDFRYLIANAMQAFTAQPLARQQDNPFTNSYLLATLIIPHLETYLAAHSEVRFLLLEYPPDHLATVLALQNLVGLDLIKVAQIVDSNAKEPLPFNHIRGEAISSRGAEKPSLKPQTSNSTLKRGLSPSRATTVESLSYTKANFLLTSSATDAEITSFTSTIWKILTEISSFYQLEEAASPKTKTSPQRTFSPFPKASPRPQSPISPTPSATKFQNAVRPPSPSTSVKAPSIAETIMTVRSFRSRKGPPLPPKEGRVKQIDAESMLTLDLEDDSDFEDLEEKRLMPIFMKRPPVRKGNSRKALKFLGLA